MAVRVDAAQTPASPAPAGSARMQLWKSRASNHWPFLVLLAAATTIRVVVTIGFKPILWVIGDSISYLGYTVGMPAVPFRPAGYSYMLYFLKPFHSLMLVAVSQHLMGLATGAMIYLLCLRLGLGRWPASLAAVPVLFDAWQITIEENLMSDALFIFLLMSAVVLAAWWLRQQVPPWWAVATSGLLMGAATDVRTVGAVLVVPILVLLFACRARLVHIGLAMVMFAAPVVAYAGYFDSQFGWFGLGASGFMSYGRVAAFADCRGASLTPTERRLCPTPAEQRNGWIWLQWSEQSPLDRFPGTFEQTNSAAKGFVVKIIEHQPGTYAKAVWKDLVKAFSPSIDWKTDDVRVSPSYPPLPSDAELYSLYYQHGTSGHTVPSAAIERWFASYQRHIYVPGIVFLLALAVSAAGAIFGRSDRGGSLRWLAASCAGTAALLLFVPPMTVGFSNRYLIPALPPLSVAAIAGATLLIGRLREGPTQSLEP